MFSGRAVERLSIISLGVMPYITASIVMELIAATFPAIGKLKKERDGIVKYMQIIRIATIFITLIQAVGVSVGLQSLSQGGESAIMIDLPKFVAISAVSMLAGTMLLMWLGEQITKRGIGNGISLIIFAGIVSSIPSAIGQAITSVNNDPQFTIFHLIGIAVIVLLTVGAIIFVEMGERRIPVSYSRKVVMQNQNKRIMNYVPVKINLSGVIPPIFASAVLMFPATIFQASNNPIIQSINYFMSPSGYFFHFLMFLFVIFFAYFYASIVFNAKDISENLKKQGGFIPGVRPGASTAEFLNETASRLTLFGATYLALISTAPWLILNVLSVQQFAFGGTSVLIVVQVALDTMRKIEAQIYMSKYETLSAVGL
jgi:preprotein translocase subunit SecY